MKLFPELIGTFKTGLHVSKCVSFGENIFNDVWWTIDVNNEEKKTYIELRELFSMLPSMFVSVLNTAM